MMMSVPPKKIFVLEINCKIEGFGKVGTFNQKSDKNGMGWVYFPLCSDLLNNQNSEKEKIKIKK